MRGRGLAVVGQLASGLGGRVHTSWPLKALPSFSSSNFPLTEVEQPRCRRDSCWSVKAEEDARSVVFSGRSRTEDQPAGAKVALVVVFQPQ